MGRIAKKGDGITGQSPHVTLDGTKRTCREPRGGGTLKGTRLSEVDVARGRRSMKGGEKTARRNASYLD